MSIAGLTSTDQATAIKAVFATNDVRTFIANHLGVSVGRVTDEAHFTDDLGADWLDRLDLMIAVEDQFAGVEITDGDVDRIEFVGDLIRHIETLDSERRRRGAAPVLRNLFGPYVARAMKPTKQQEGCDEAALFFLRLADRHKLNRSPGSSTMLRARGSMAPSWRIIARSNPMPS